MRKFQEKRRLRRRLFSPITLTALLALFIFLSIQTVGVYKKSRLAILKNEKIKGEINELQQRKTDLGNDINRLQSEFGSEAEIRKKFNVQKPGEKVLMIVDKKRENAKIEITEEENGFSKKVWQAVKSFLRN